MTNLEAEIIRQCLDDAKKELTYLAEHGLRVQGEHHKQWFLGQILRNINREQYDRLQANKQDMGIAP